MSWYGTFGAILISSSGSEVSLFLKRKVRPMVHIPASAKANVYFKGFDERFATYVTADPVARRIEVKLARGPFRHLRNRWQFDPRDDGKTRVHCFIDYEFKNPVLSLLARTNSRLAVELIIDAFRAEADRRFSNQPPAQPGN